MTFVEHLSELRQRLRNAAIVFLIAVFGSFYFVKHYFVLLTKPARAAWVMALNGQEPIWRFSSPTEPFWVYTKLAMYGALLIASPFVFWELWKFVAPGLYRREKRLALLVTLATAACFIGGALFGYAVLCKPALTYMLDMMWCGDHEEDRSARYINDRVHANIQKDGTFSVIPRIRGGVTSPEELRRIADVAEKYAVPMVKITGSQRIDLLGVKKEDLPAVWADMGMPSGQAYTKGVRMVKTCVGTEFCRFGTQDSTAAGIEMERRFEQLFTPHKVKMAAVGCPRNCAEATVKDIGLVGQEGGWQVVVGGAAGKSVRKADLLTTVESTEDALVASEIFFQYYRENANYLERTYDFVERLGIEKVRKETVYAPEPVRQGLLDRLRKSKARSRDAWQEGAAPRHPTQFRALQVIDPVLR